MLHTTIDCEPNPNRVGRYTVSVWRRGRDKRHYEKASLATRARLEKLIQKWFWRYPSNTCLYTETGGCFGDFEDAEPWTGWRGGASE